MSAMKLKLLLTSDVWNKEESIVALCLFRLGFLLIVCAQAINWLPFTKELFSDQGFHQGFLSAWAPTPLLAKVLCIFLIVASFSAAVGFRTRTSLFITLFVWTFFFLIDQINEKALDTIAIINFIILLCSQSGAR